MKRGKYAKRYPSGSMAALNWQQFKDFLRYDNQASWKVEAARTETATDNLLEKIRKERIVQSLEPARAHAELTESDKQNRFAAELWKAHAESAAKSLRLHAKVLELLADTIAFANISDKDITQTLRDAAAAMKSAKLD